ncbi:MAG: endolytic transglycosylase MltG [Clostridiales bacterium]|nr:endolytic transglycosylase MltG [Clostridiales bacterium]
MSDKNFNNESLSKLAKQEEQKLRQSAAKDNMALRRAHELGNSRSAQSYGRSEDYDDKIKYEARDYKPIRARRDGKTGCLGGLMYFIFVVSMSIILACLGWMAASDVLALNKGDITAEVYLPETDFKEKERNILDEDGKAIGKETVLAADANKVATALKDAGIIQYKALFILYSQFSNADEKIDPGTYELNTQYDYRAIVKKMQFGSDSQVKTMVSFPEGFTNSDIFLRLEENKVCRYDDLMECAANYEFPYSFLEGIPYGETSRLEGFLFPDTYEFYQGMTADAAIDKFLQTFHYKLTEEMLELASSRGYSMRQVVNVASMIEKEAANDEERKTIAGVIYNRLNANMALGIDATIQYILPERKELLTWDDLEIDSPYNTYKNLGLPAGPIANPGISSIMAALKPESHGYYYYALDEQSNTHRFFTNGNDHAAFVKTQSYGQ